MAGEEPRPPREVTYQHEPEPMPLFRREQITARLEELSAMHREALADGSEVSLMGAEVTMIRCDQWLDEMLRLRGIA